MSELIIQRSHTKKYMFTILNQTSGNTFKVSGDEFILDGAIANGVNFPYGCQNGFCGQCKATLIDGEVDYTEDGIPPGITPEEVDDNMVLLCRCKAKSDVSIVVSELDDSANIEVKTLPCKVQKIERLSHDVAKVLLKIPGDESLQYLPGQYIDVIHPDFEPRAFSIANSPANSSLIEIHVRLINDGKFTNFVFNELQENSLLKIEGPKGDFYLRENSDDPIIMVAGGTGFGPVKAMVEHAIDIGITRQIHIYWGARNEDDLYSDLAYKWDQEHDNVNFVPVLFQEDGGSWQGRKGYVHESVLEDFDNLTEYEVYACGPPEMVKATADTFTSKGMFKDSFFADSFEFSSQQV